MARRPLVATLVTTVVGSLLGAILGALVGRFIALFGDETVQTSVPMVFCGTIGYFVGGASAAKGSLDRFGARRTGVGTTLAALVLIVLVGGASLSRSSGVVVFVVAVLAAAAAGAAAALVGGPQAEPVVRGQRPRAVGAKPAEPKAKAPKSRQPLEQAEVEAIVEAPKPAIRKVAVAPEPEREPEPEPEGEPVAASDDSVNWSLDEAPVAPRRREPLRATRPDETPTKRPVKKAPAVKKAAPKITPPPSARGRRDRPLRKDDA